MTDRELLQMALDALEHFEDEYGWGMKQKKAHRSLQIRLAQPELESIGQHEFIDTTAKWGRDFVEVLNPLEENAILRFYHEPLQQPEPEPVAVVSGYYGGHCVILPLNLAQVFSANTALYIAPPQREWIGLTDAERADCSTEAYGRHYVLCELIEAKLKEKNGV